jgi:hypothetical protein
MAMICPFASIDFVHVEFFVYCVLSSGVPENENDKNDQRALRSHIESQRKSDDPDFIQRWGKQVDNEAENQPNRQAQPHQVARLVPIGDLALMRFGHGVEALLYVAATL